MDYVRHYDSPLGGITLASDGEALTGLWFDGQKHFGSTLAAEYAEADRPVLREAARWLDRYFGDVCRRPTGEPAGPWFFEPKCQPCRSCGYQPITPRTPAWYDPGEDEKEEAK